MLSQSLLVALLRRAIPEWRDGKTCQCRTRSRQSICQKAHALPFSARRFSSPDWQDSQICQFCTRCCRRACQTAHALSYSARRTTFLPALSHDYNIVGGMGLAPCLQKALDLRPCCPSPLLPSLLLFTLQQTGLAQEVAHFLCDGGKLRAGDGSAGDKDNLSAFGDLGQIQPQALF